MRATLAAVAAIGILAAVPAAPGATLPAPIVSLHASKRSAQSGQQIVLSGVASGIAAGTPVQLFQSRFPFRGSRLIATTVAAASGQFSFTVKLDRTTRYRVAVAGA